METTKNKNELVFYHAFSCIGGFGPQKFNKLLSRFGTLEKAWSASREDLLAADIGLAATKNFLEKRNALAPEKLFSELEKDNVGIITQNHESYPPQLKEIPSAPTVLYGRGNLEILKSKSVAVVGSRKFTEYGRRVTQNLCRDLVRARLTIVSGLALGIDAIAHRAALDAEGATIAVLGTGIDDATIYPRDNFNLAKDILSSGGTLISEFPPRTPSLKQNFPARNRIMAGLALGTLVVEAAESSGSLITAGLALEFSREVFAVPGPIFSPQSAGTNYLIKNGAKLTESAADILQELNLDRFKGSMPKKIFEPKTIEEKAVWNVLGSDPLHVDRIAKLTKLNPAVAGSTLAMMEIEEAVRNVGGQNYIKM
ncbi:MAG: DNA-processing protein DprA [Patescibacteria group bacterium]|nr:DNA-processing protein DprA [Patescibacteria group bacterium]